MAEGTASGALAGTLASVRSKIVKYRANRGFNEQNTKASLIVPVLQALGWDTNDPDEVHWEYKPKPKYNPVDFALLLQRTPCLLIEAKALRESLADDKLVAQILTYASVAGVQWVVLTNGDEYRIYNASAPLPVEDKLFRRVALSSNDASGIESTLALLSKRDLQDKKITRLWESHFVDRQVKVAVEELLNPEDPATVIVKRIRTLTDGRLRDSEIRASLRRLRLQLDFPQEPELAVPAAAKRPRARAGERSPRRRHDPDLTRAKSEISIEVLIQAGLIKAPAQIVSHYRGHDLTATLREDGTIEFGGATFESLSTAGGMARQPFHQGDLKGRPYPQTNGWTFWSIRDPESQKVVPLDALRDRHLQRKRVEGDRFRKAAD